MSNINGRLPCSVATLINGDALKGLYRVEKESCKSLLEKACNVKVSILYVCMYDSNLFWYGHIVKIPH